MIVKIAAMDVKLNSYPVNIKKPIEAVKSCIKDNIAPTLNPPIKSYQNIYHYNK